MVIHANLIKNKTIQGEILPLVATAGKEVIRYIDIYGAI